MSVDTDPSASKESSKPSKPATETTGADTGSARRPSKSAELSRSGELAKSVVYQEWARHSLEGLGQGEFRDRAVEIVSRGGHIAEYLKTHVGDPDLVDQDFKRLAILSRCASILNAKLYRIYIEEASSLFKNSEVAQIVGVSAENGKIDAKLATDWAGTQYASKLNDDRESFREGIYAQTTNITGDNRVEPGFLDHLERYLDFGGYEKGFDNKIVAYAAAPEKIKTISNLATMPVTEFYNYLFGLTNGISSLDTNDNLRSIDEEIASIKDGHLRAATRDQKAEFVDREAKQRLIRDVRFGRVTAAQLQEKYQEFQRLQQQAVVNAGIEHLGRDIGQALRGKPTETVGQLKEIAAKPLDARAGLLAELLLSKPQLAPLQPRFALALGLQTS